MADLVSAPAMVDLEQLYSRAYYLSDCEGFSEFHKTWGRKPSRRLAKCIELLGPGRGQRIVDLGCGRGEVALNAAVRGAQVVAVDGSPDALTLLREAADRWPNDMAHDAAWKNRIETVVTPLDCLPLDGSSFDAAVMSDVIEHIPRPQILSVLRECLRVLKPAGRLVIHTQPNRLLVDWTVPFLSRLAWMWGVRIPRNLREEMTAGARGDYHPSEQSRGELRDWLQQANFVIDELWLEGSYPLHRIFGDTRLKQFLLRRFRQNNWLKELLAGQIFAICHRPNAARKRRWDTGCGI